MQNFVKIQDFENHALKVLLPSTKDFYSKGTGNEDTLRLNKEAFKKIRIRPRMLRNVSKRDISTTILGKKISMPVGISPTGTQKLAHPDGECANAKAAEAFNTIFILSTYSNSSIQEVAKAAPQAIKWFQTTVHKDRDCTVHCVRKAEQAGFKAIVLTIDNPIMPKSKDLSKTKRLNLNKYAVYEDYFLTKYSSDKLGDVYTQIKKIIDDSLTWEDVTWMTSITKLPIIVKGVLTPEDALLAVKHGASAIIVSNHGGRELDGVFATIEALPGIVKAVGNKVEIYLDGGIRQGTDVFKALALGAKMVFMGRPMLWGLACGGEEGSKSVLKIIQEELDEAFAFTGCSSVQQVTKDLVVHESLLSHL